MDYVTIVDTYLFTISLLRSVGVDVDEVKMAEKVGALIRNADLNAEFATLNDRGQAVMARYDDYQKEVVVAEMAKTIAKHVYPEQFPA
jgi:hypothetical protein